MQAWTQRGAQHAVLAPIPAMLVLPVVQRVLRLPRAVEVWLLDEHFVQTFHGG